MIKKISLLALVVLTFGIDGMDKAPSSDADKKVALDQLQKKLRNHISDNDWPIRKELMRTAIVDGIHPDTIEIKFELIDNPLYQAVSFSDAEFVQFLLNNEASPHYIDRLEYPLLHNAKTVKIAQLLVDAGTSIDAKGGYLGKTVLHTIATDLFYKPALITFYGNKGIDSAAVNTFGFTALIDIARTDWHYKETCEKARRLINIGVPLNSRVQDPNCLHYNLTALQIVKKRLVEENAYKGLYLPQAFILSIKARNKNLKNMLEAHVSRDCAGVITAYLEDRALIDKDVQELEAVLRKKQLFELVTKEHSQTPEFDAKKVAHLIATGMPLDISLDTQKYNDQDLSPIQIVAERVIGVDRTMHQKFPKAFLAAVNDRKKHVAQALDPHMIKDLARIALEYYEDEESLKAIET